MTAVLGSGAQSMVATRGGQKMHRFPTIQKNAGNFGNLETAQ
jgi:hypothetical protein